MAPSEVELGILPSGHPTNEQSRHASTDQIQLNSQEENSSPHEHEFSLPPVDGGKDAWLYLIAAFFIEMLVWGKDLQYNRPFKMHKHIIHAEDMADRNQAFPSPTEFSKSTTVAMNRLPAAGTSPSSEPAQWVLCICPPHLYSVLSIDTHGSDARVLSLA
jgi:hypothetical protein